MHPSIRWNSFLFDLDGTLVDSEGVAGEAIAATFTKLSLEFEPRHKGIILGRTWNSAAQDFHQEFPHLSIADWEKALRAEYLKRIENEVQLVPGVIEALEWMHELPIRKGVVTGSQSDEVEIIFRKFNLDRYIEKCWTAEHYSVGKPSPIPFQTAVQEWGLAPSQTLVFEDSAAGMDSAVAAGLDFVQITHCHPGVVKNRHAIVAVNDWRSVDLDFLSALSDLGGV